MLIQVSSGESVAKAIEVFVEYLMVTCDIVWGSTISTGFLDGTGDMRMRGNWDYDGRLASLVDYVHVTVFTSPE